MRVHGFYAIFWDSFKRKLQYDKPIAPPEVPDALKGSAMFPDELLKLETHGVIKALFAPFDTQAPDADFLTRIAYSEFKLRLPELLLMRVDKIAMSTSLEARVPYLDHHLVELTMDLPQHLRVGNGKPKYLLKKVVRDLIPEVTINRKKSVLTHP